MISGSDELKTPAGASAPPKTLALANVLEKT